jgi:hypothetical protein
MEEAAILHGSYEREKDFAYSSFVRFGNEYSSGAEVNGSRCDISLSDLLEVVR